MKELIELLNEGWRVKTGYRVNGLNVVIMKKTFMDIQNNEFHYPMAVLTEDSEGNVTITKAGREF